MAMTSQSLFLLITFIVEISITGILAIYAIAHLGHSNDTQFASLKSSKAIIWAGMTIGFIPIFLVGLDADKDMV